MKKERKGSAILEGALVMSTAMFMIIFVMEMGRFLMIQQWTSERARTVARMAAVNNWDQTAVGNVVCYNSTTAPQGGGPGYMGLVPSEVTYARLGSAGAADDRVQVKIQNVPVLTWLPLISGTYKLPPVVVTVPTQSLGATN